MSDKSAEPAEQATLNVTGGWESICEGMGRQRLEMVSLPEFLPKQRWFGGKSRHIRSTRIINWIPLGEMLSALVIVEVQFEAGEPSVYLIPLALASGEDADELRRTTPNSIVAPTTSGK